jgi:ATP-binding cassette subfamily B multidrug efflux pump
VSADSLHDEDELGKAYDGRMLARLWPFVRPYMRLFFVDMLLVVPLFALELAPGWIIKYGLDSVFGGIDGGIDGGASDLTTQTLAIADYAGAWASRWLEPPALFSALGWLALLYGCISLALAALQFIHMYLSAWLGQLAMRDLRTTVFDHIQKLHLGFFDRYPVGRLVTRATNDVENVAEMFSAGLVALVVDVAKMFGYAAILFAISWKLSLFTFAVVPVLAVAAVIFRLKVREAFRETRLRIARINAQIQETITGMKVVQLFTREGRNNSDFDRMNALNRDAWHRSNRWEGRLFSVVEVAQNLTVAIILGYGYGLAAIGTFYLFIDYMRRFFMPLRDLSAKYSVMQSSMAGAERIFELLDTQPEVVDRPESGEPGHHAPGKRGAVVFEDVWFAYNSRGSESDASEEWVLQDLNFHVEPGEKIAFVGATGAGKTSLIKLLTRLYEPQRGRILLDGRDLARMPQTEVRRQVATVLQDVFLFSGTIEENIALGREDISHAQVESAARTVEAHPFIERLPDGYRTELRERGANLSVGQRQLLSFARAVAHGADILVLDEATSSIDTETEILIQRGVHNLMQGRTAIAIAHRLSTVQDMDRIYVLHKGRIQESGTHDELLALEGFYYRLYRLQYRTEQVRIQATA